MKKNLLFVLAALALVIAGAGTMAFVLHMRAPVPVQGGPSDPFGNLDGDTAAKPVPTMSVPTATGSLTTSDFINNGETAADTVNPGRYILAGDAGYCIEGGSCPQGAEATDFSIAYDAGYGQFTIALLAEPLGEARLHAEQFLRARLGISSTDMCALTYEVLVPGEVNEAFAGDNLGFSFCPGSIRLP